MNNPYLISGPAVISFSGGRSSGYMLYHILQAHNGILPDDVKAVFCNTGKEMTETLDFIQECSDRWNVPITWLEYNPLSVGKFDIVSHNSASRNGEPFTRLNDAKGFLPNPVARLCTVNLKIRTTISYLKSLGWDYWDNAIGLRADEPRRVAKLKGDTSRETPLCPMYHAGVTKATVGEFWKNQPFDLRLPNINGKTPFGNCDMCFLKSFPTLMGIMRDKPHLATWWIEQESTARNSAKEGATFRKDRPSYAQMLKQSQDQPDMLSPEENESMIDCFCSD